MKADPALGRVGLEVGSGVPNLQCHRRYLRRVCLILDRGGGTMRGRVLAGSIAAFVIAFAPAGAHANYSTDPFTVSTHPFSFGQAPVFMPDGRVVVGKDYSRARAAGLRRGIRRHGARASPATCTGRAQQRPDDAPAGRLDPVPLLGRAQPHDRLARLRRDGLRAVGDAARRLAEVTHSPASTRHTAPARARTTTTRTGRPTASSSSGRTSTGTSSPTAATANGTSASPTSSTTASNPPHLANERVVRPANGHWYETQWWAPDGSGFLYTETWGTAMNIELFFCKL